MGVPAFFRWLSRKYPSIVVNCVEEKPREIEGVSVPVDATQPNPLGLEFDNLYLDMNGIIHPCCHPEDKPAPKNEDEMMVAIFEYIDRLFLIVRPRRLLYMAIDGTAPRAKMNQQRSRRFRAAKESYEKQEEIRKVRERLELEGMPLPPEKEKGEHFDSNCITPGTPFMARLAVCLRYYVYMRANSDPAWAKIQVILSDANCPGEGEHKIMDYIRRQRASPSHDPNTHHCLCGADADLIMLGLATHEPNFTIIREEFVPQKQRPCELCGQYGHELQECKGMPDSNFDEFAELPKGETNFIFIRLNVLREYLERDLVIPNLPFEYSFERAIDDWVFMCFFVGNDFLPHLPSLEIREGAIDRLIRIYKNTIYRTGGYLTDSGYVHLDRVQVILNDLGQMEDEIFKMRQDKELQMRERNKQRKRREKRAANAPAFIPGGQFTPSPLGGPQGRGGGRNHFRNQGPASGAGSAPGGAESAGREIREDAAAMRMHGPNWEAARDLKTKLKEGGGNNEDGGNGKNAEEHQAKEKPQEVLASPAEERGTKRKAAANAAPNNNNDEEEPVPPDEVRLWEAGWKERYYQSKFEVSEHDTQFKFKVARAYAEGLCWVLRYYYQGCCSWKWFYPFHYAPFASDFVNLGDEKFEFDKDTKPFNQLEQLMGVFPAASRQHIPEPWGELMIDPSSQIVDFYPDDFVIDLNGKRYAWQGVALLPFVDEKRLLAALDTVYDRLTLDEQQRNTRGQDLIFVSGKHPGAPFLQTVYEKDGGGSTETGGEGEGDPKNKTSEDADGGGEEQETMDADEGPGTGLSEKVQMDPSHFFGMAGTITKFCDVVPTSSTVKSPLPDCESVENNQTVCVSYYDPVFAEDYFFSAKRLEGAVDPPKTLKPQDWDNRRNYQPVMGFGQRTDRARLSDGGHRMLDHNSGRGNRYSGEYSNMPPPQRGRRGGDGRYHSTPDLRSDGREWYGSTRAKGSSPRGNPFVPRGRGRGGRDNNNAAFRTSGGGGGWRDGGSRWDDSSSYQQMPYADPHTPTYGYGGGPPAHGGGSPYGSPFGGHATGGQWGPPPRAGGPLRAPSPRRDPRMHPYRQAPPAAYQQRFGSGHY